MLPILPQRFGPILQIQPVFGAPYFAKGNRISLLKKHLACSFRYAVFIVPCVQKSQILPCPFFSPVLGVLKMSQKNPSESGRSLCENKKKKHPEFIQKPQVATVFSDFSTTLGENQKNLGVFFLKKKQVVQVSHFY